MLRHCVLLTFQDDVGPPQLEALTTALAELADLPMVASYRFGTDLGLAEGNVDFAIVADFASVDDYQAYATDPTHQAVLQGQLRPLIAERRALQFEF